METHGFVNEKVAYGQPFKNFARVQIAVVAEFVFVGVESTNIAIYSQAPTSRN